MVDLSTFKQLSKPGLTEEQVYKIINLIKFPRNAVILTNDFVVSVIFLELKKRYPDKYNKELYFVTNNEEEATFLHIEGMAAYVTSIDAFIREHKRFFDHIILSVKDVSQEALREVSGVITNGAKDGCITFIIAQCNSVSERIMAEVEGVVDVIDSIYDSELPEQEKIDTCVCSVYLPFAAAPWYSDREKTSRCLLKEAVLPNILTRKEPEYLNSDDPRHIEPDESFPGVEANEFPFLGTANYALAHVMTRYLNSFCMQTASFQIPRRCLSITDGKFSIGVVCVFSTWRHSSSINQKTYREKCWNILVNERISYCTMDGSSPIMELDDQEYKLTYQPVSITIKKALRQNRNVLFSVKNKRAAKKLTEENS